MVAARNITIEDADTLLHGHDVVHIIDVHPASQPSELYRSRTWLLEYFKKHGVSVSGELSRSAHHGLCSPSPTGGIWYIETKHG